jgi:mevalonate kinase
MKPVKCSAPAKVILFGEHFVVGGRKAIVTAVDRRAAVRCTPRDKGILVRSGGSWALWDRGRVVGKADYSSVRSLKPYYVMAAEILGESGGDGGVEIEIQSDIPKGAGLGSSAAVAVAGVKALTTMLGIESSVQDVVRYAMICEKIVHGRPSGIDVHIAALGGTLIYGSVTEWEKIDVMSPQILVVDTGGRRGTGRLVQSVQSFAQTSQEVFKELTLLYDQLLIESLDALKRGDLKAVGRCMNANQVLLRILGVSSNSLERAIASVLSRGVYGAKLTGAGGGGCVIAVGEREVMRQALEHIAAMYPGSWLANTSTEGVRLEHH